MPEMFTTLLVARPWAAVVVPLSRVTHLVTVPDVAEALAVWAAASVTFTGAAGYGVGGTGYGSNPQRNGGGGGGGWFGGGGGACGNVGGGGGGGGSSTVNASTPVYYSGSTAYVGGGVSPNGQLNPFCGDFGNVTLRSCTPAAAQLDGPILAHQAALTAAVDTENSVSK